MSYFKSVICDLLDIIKPFIQLYFAISLADSLCCCRCYRISGLCRAQLRLKAMFKNIFFQAFYLRLSGRYRQGPENPTNDHLTVYKYIYIYVYSCWVYFSIILCFVVIL